MREFALFDIAHAGGVKVLDMRSVLMVLVAGFDRGPSLDEYKQAWLILILE